MIPQEKKEKKKNLGYFSPSSQSKKVGSAGWKACDPGDQRYWSLYWGEGRSLVDFELLILL